ncbi:MAG: response regulator [Myxococcales bacterium]|nr:response regulator [Myxococcales bacterium]
MSHVRLRRSVFVKVLLVVLAAGVLGLGIATGVSVVLVADDKEASLGDAAVLQARRLSDQLDRRIERARSDLAAAAIAGHAGRPLLAREVLGQDLVAVRVDDGDHVILEASTDAETRGRVAALDLTEGEVRRLSPTEIALRADVRSLRARAILDARDVLASVPPEWDAALTARSDGIPGSVVARRLERDGEDSVHVVATGVHGLAVEASASLAPAREGAFRVVRQVLFWSWIGLLPLSLLALFLSRRVTSPLRRLADAVETADAGDAIVLPALPDDEIGELGHAIGAMSGRVRSDADALRRAVRFARHVGAATHRDAVFEELRAVLSETVPDVTWRVVSTDELEETDGDVVAGVPRDVLERGISTVDSGHSLQPPPLNGSARARRPSIETPRLGTHDDRLFIALGVDGTTYGVAVGESSGPPGATRIAQLHCRVATAALRNLDLAQEALAAEKLAALGRLAASIAHEVNNPLSAVISNLHVLQLELEGDSLEVVDDALGAARRVSMIVRDLSLLARGGRTVSVTTEDLPSIVGRAVQALGPRADGIAIRREGPHELRVVCAPSRIEQAVSNLVSNAVDASRAHRDGRGGEVVVRILEEDDRVIVRVEDDGPGVPLRMRRQLFEPFATGKGEKGSGLGLYLARTFARTHGGDVRLVSTGAKGTVFELWIPLPTAGTASPKERPTDPAPRPRPRLLLLDDDPLVLRAAKRWLGSRADVVTAQNEPEAMAALDRQVPDLLLCDLSLGAADGRQVAARLVTLHPSLEGRVAFVSGAAAGGDDVFLKPLREEDLDRILARAQGAPSPVAERVG